MGRSAGRVLVSAVSFVGLALAIGGCSGASDEVLVGPPIVTGLVTVYEEKDGNGQVIGTIQESLDGKQRRISGQFRKDLTLQKKYTWLLVGAVTIGDKQGGVKATLTIEPGTLIQGRSTTPPSLLLIARDARIVADGTVTEPIVFTSAQPAGARRPGDWGGLVINGNAPVNNGVNGQPPTGEGGSGPYGGNDPNDDSGVLRYVRVEFAGSVFSADDELNGIAFQGVGRGTVVDFVQVHRTQDDGMEFFGGTVDVRHVLITGALDDCFDWTGGWSGRAQFVVLQQYPGGADNGIEADNNGASNDALPRAKPVLSNFTIVGPSQSGAPSDIGLLLRAGTGGKLSNFIVIGMNECALDIDDLSTWINAFAGAPASYTTLSGELTLTGSFLFGNLLGEFRNDSGDPQTDTAFNALQSPANRLEDPLLTAPQSLTNPDWRPQASSPVLSGAQVPSDPFFTVVGYAGALGASDTWPTGWTTAEQN